MEYIWTRPLMENRLLHWRGQMRQPCLVLFWLFVSVVFQADSFFIALLLSILSSTYETFFFCPFCYFVPFLRCHLLLQKLFFFSSFMTLHISLSTKTWNQKEAARRGDFFLSLSPPFLLGYDLLIFRPFLFFFFPFFSSISSLAGRLNGGRAKCVRMRIAPREERKEEKRIRALQERKADTELALLVEKVGSMSAHTIAMGVMLE
ncbi:hypothetical protein J3F84DRAFT_288069 [Trichoderma pleuroticola]